MPRTRIAGDEHDGSYSASFTLDEQAERGLWRVEYVMLVDNAGNRRDYSRDQLTALAFPTSILVRQIDRDGREDGVRTDAGGRR